MTRGDSHELTEAVAPGAAAGEGIERQVEHLRERLLDLSLRNRLLNFRHPERTRTQVRVIDERPALLYRGLVSERAYRFRAVEELSAGAPAPRVAVAEAARRQGLNPDFELAAQGDGPIAARHDDAVIQTACYPDELARRLEGMRQEHLTSIQELGVPTLYALFGFLDWSDGPRRDLLSPLVLVPLDIERTRTRGQYQYKVVATSDEPEPNRTLVHRLRGYLEPASLSLDSLLDDSDLDAYFAQVEHAIEGLEGWRVRRMVTVAVVSSARQVMYEDLSAGRWAERGGRAAPLVRRLLAGEDGPAAAAATPRVPLLVTDADATQVEAISAALGGQSLVVKGPPGTGKSQTITNLIAAALAEGERVLFVAEKMAALEVVKKRLDEAGLGPFCLALHSTKASKREVLNALAVARAARDTDFPVGNLAALERERASCQASLDAYLAAMARPAGRLDVSWREIVWREQALRARLATASPSVLTFQVPGASELDPAMLRARKRDLAEFGLAVAALAMSPLRHPWSFVTTYDVAAHREDVLLAAVRAWHAAMRELLALIESVGWPGAAMSRIQLVDLASQLADVYQVGAAAPADLILRLVDPPTRTTVSTVLRCLDESNAATSALAVHGDPESALRHAAAIRELGEAVSGIALPPTATLAGLRTIVTQRRAQVDAADAGLSRAMQLLARTGTRHAFDSDLLRLLLDATRLIAGSDPSILRARDPSLDDPDAVADLEEAAQLAEQLRTTAAAIDAEFHGWRALGAKELRRHATVLRATGPFGRLFDSEYKATRRVCQALTTGRHMPREPLASTLERAARFLEALAIWEGERALRRLGGRGFAGLDTDFARLQRVAAWIAELRVAFPGNNGRTRELRDWVLRAEVDELADWAAFHRDHGPALEDALRSWPADTAVGLIRARASLAKVEEAAAQVSGAALSPRIRIVDLPLVASAAERLATARARLASYGTIARETLGPHWANGAPEPELLRAAIAASTALADIRLPDYVEAWVRSEASGANLAAAAPLASRLRVALGREATHRAEAAHAGVGLADLDGPDAPLQAVAERLGSALAAPDAAAAWLRYRTLRAACEQTADARAFLRVMEEAGGPWSALDATFEWCVLRSLCALALVEHPQLTTSEWSGATLEHLRDRLRAIDAELVTQRRRALACRLAGVPVPAGRRVGPRSDWTDDALLSNEIGKQKRHLSIRRLVARAHRAITAVAPCFMMSPLSVAQFLEDPDLQFDLLVIDEASQLRPEDALGALLRARRTVIVGDEEQLPPTDFFRAAEEEADEFAEVEVDAASVLELARETLGSPRVLRWHYRSRHQTLIHFSNEQFYAGALIVPPAPTAPGARVGVELRRVAGTYAASTNPIEANYVVDLALEVMAATPNLSLGVVAVNQQQADLIRERLDERLGAAGGDYVDRWKSTLEWLFVKNLENVQGDERDVIIVSLTYGPGPDGRVLQNFGPISGAHGHRRLNVLFSRAKHRLLVATALRPEDIRVGPASNRGPAVLRDYLAFAQAPATATRVTPPDGDDVYVHLGRELAELGFDADRAAGTRHVQLAFGVQHPDLTTGYVAGIELDAGEVGGPQPPRDRDGTRPVVLDRMGWHRVPAWTGDWLRGSGQARVRLVEALRRACGAQGLAMPPVRAVVSVIAATHDAAPVEAAVIAPAPLLTGEIWVADRHLRRFEAQGERLRIGRSARCDIRIDDQYEEVASVHATVVWHAPTRRFRIADSAGRGGTYVDGQRVSERDLQPGHTHGVRLGIGAVTLRLVYNGALAPNTAAAPPVAEVPAKTVPPLVGIVDAVGVTLTPDELQFLTLVQENGSVRSSEVAAQLGRSAIRANGLARALRKKLYDATGVAAFVDEQLPNGEIMYRLASGLPPVS